MGLKCIAYYSMMHPYFWTTIGGGETKSKGGKDESNSRGSKRVW